MSSTLHCKEHLKGMDCCASHGPTVFSLRPTIFFFEEGFMPDVVRALAISGGILLGVVVLMIAVCSVAVRRGEAQMAADAKQHGHSSH